MMSSGALPNVAFQQPAYGITGPRRDLLRRVDKQARNWNDGKRRGKEHERSGKASDVLERDRDGHKRKQPVE
jgi:hypothetical protein